MKLRRKIAIFIVLTTLGILIGKRSARSIALEVAKRKQHEADVFRHESECYDLQVCLESTLSFASDICYPITPIWGWPGERTADLLSACKLFKKIRSVNAQ